MDRQLLRPGPNEEELVAVALTDGSEDREEPPPRLRLCAVAFLDLLGYGTQLTAASGQLNHPIGKIAVDRIRQFHNTPALVTPPAAYHVARLNDAAVVVLDLEDQLMDGSITVTETFLHTRTLTLIGSNQFWGFLRWTRELHDAVRSQQRSSGNPGARTIVVLGERLDASGVGVLDLNMAFAAAYIADQGGTAKGLRGDYLFVDWMGYLIAAAVKGVPTAFEPPPRIVGDVEIFGKAHSFMCIPPVPSDQPRGAANYVSTNPRWISKLPHEE